MFGYIKPFRPELKVVEDELYRSIYCGLCRNMGKSISQTYRFTLNYDAVFLALVRIAASGETVITKRGRCVVHPIKKRNYIIAPLSLTYCSRAFAILAKCKSDDDISDSKGVTKLCAVTKSIPIRRYGKKSDFASLSAEIDVHLANLRNLENTHSNMLSALADEFGYALGLVFSHETEGSINRILYDIGYHTGKWIYITDAVDDYFDDKKAGRFNPFLSVDGIPVEDIEQSLNLELLALSHSIDLLPECQKGIRNIIDNIVYLGMPQTAKTVLNKAKERNK
ncbi:MAG: DUF5685 family protein [Clostridia bacterium]|nr:DUF5685 family protein [Clostridia bacterium]